MKDHHRAVQCRVFFQLQGLLDRPQSNKVSMRRKEEAREKYLGRGGSYRWEAGGAEASEGVAEGWRGDLRQVFG